MVRFCFGRILDTDSNSIASFQSLCPVVGPAFARTSSAKMVPVELTESVNSFVAQNSNVIATSAGDFGGYFYPVVGLTLLGALILYLSPPLSSEE